MNFGSKLSPFPDILHLCHVYCLRALVSTPATSPPLSASLQPLLREDFDAKTFATTTIQCQMVGETLQKLANGIAALDKELYSQVVHGSKTVDALHRIMRKPNK